MTFPLWFLVATAAAVVCGLAIGGYLGLRTKRRKR